MRTLTFLLASLLAAPLTAQVTTKLVATGLNRPLWAGAPMGDERIFVATKAGQIRVVKSGALLATPFLDIAAKVSTLSERGLLGVAFHPNYASNGSFYVNYSDLAGDTVVARFQVSADPDVADPLSESVVLTQGQPFDNHNGGDIQFGPLDGYLYIFFGDGGSGGDPGCRAQKTTTLLGKIVRIDVDAGAPYAIPPTNPFIGMAGVREEIYHLGLRNPWRNGFDALTGDLYIGDVGQDLREEIDFAPAGVGGLNFGWKVMEGTSCFGTSNCPPATLLCNDPSYVLPITELTHASGARAITGGTVYRGCANPSEFGKYFFSDFADNKIRSLNYDVVNGVTNLADRTAEFAPGGGLAIRSIVHIGTDGFGELLIVEHSGGTAGEVFKMVPAGAVQATALVRNGGGTNRTCLTNTGLPIIGSVWEAELDATPHAGATTSLVVGFQLPTSGIFLGANELLVDTASTSLFQLSIASGGTIDRI
ncbi:MAG: PQQ-dependent sugar dehydrogenase, partial [Planctomycetota bacterium]